MGFYDRALGLSPGALEVRARRMQVLAANIANADTPGYKAKDIDFAAAMRQVAGVAHGLARTHRNHLQDLSEGEDELLYREPAQPSLDGNTVETHREHAALMDNAIRYQASLSLLDSRLRSLRTAIRGQA